MHKWIFLLTLLTGSLYADYSSLTPVEKVRVEKAFKESKYYKYYEALVDGKDNIKIVKINKIREILLAPNFVEHFYELEINLTIKDKVFKRNMPISFKTLATAAPAVDDTVIMDIVKIGGGLLVGIFIGILLPI